MPIIAFERHKPKDSDDVLALSPMDRAVDKRVFTPSRITKAAALVALLVLALYGYAQYGVYKTLSVAGERLTISEVSYRTFHEYIPVTGNVVPRTTVYLDAVEGGQVLSVSAEAGQIVEAGDSLVVLKNTNLQLEVIGREAQLTEQLNNLSTTRLAFEQNRLRHRRELIEIDYRTDELVRHLAQRRPLLAQGGVTQSEIEDLQAELVYLRAIKTAVEEAQAVDEHLQTTQMVSLQEAIGVMNSNLVIARENLENLVVTAPITGQLSIFEANIGESKAPGQRIGQIDELDKFKVSAFVDEFYLTRVTIGKIATAEFDEKSYRLEVVKVYPDVRNRQFEVELLFFGEPPKVVRRGQTLRMRLEIGQPADSLVLANGAFFDDTGGTWVFALDSTGEVASRRSVRFGRRNPEGIEILEGLRAGDRVVTSSYGNFLEVDRLNIDREI